MDLDSLQEAFQTCIEAGFVPPLHVVLIGANGYMIAMRTHPTEVLAEHSDASGICAKPINIMVVDARGEAARFVIKTPDSPPQLIQ